MDFRPCGTCHQHGLVAASLPSTSRCKVQYLLTDPLPSKVTMRHDIFDQRIRPATPFKVWYHHQDARANEHAPDLTQHDNAARIGKKLIEYRLGIGQVRSCIARRKMLVKREQRWKIILSRSTDLCVVRSGQSLQPDLIRPRRICARARHRHGGGFGAKGKSLGDLVFGQ